MIVNSIERGIVTTTHRRNGNRILDYLKIDTKEHRGLIRKPRASAWRG